MKQGSVFLHFLSAPRDKELLNLCERGIQALLEHIKEAEKTSDHVASVMKSAPDKMR